MADLGDIDAQMALGHWHLASELGVDGFMQALKWFFIAHSLGHPEGGSEASKVLLLLEPGQADDCYEEIEDWFLDKAEAMSSGNYKFADPLLRWFTSDAATPYLGH